MKNPCIVVINPTWCIVGFDLQVVFCLCLCSSLILACTFPFCVWYIFDFGLPWWSSGKESTCQYRRLSLICGSGRPLEKEMATHFCILAGKIPSTEKPGRLQSMGSQRVGHSLVTKQQKQQIFGFGTRLMVASYNELRGVCPLFSSFLE